MGTLEASQSFSSSTEWSIIYLHFLHQSMDFFSVSDINSVSYLLDSSLFYLVIKSVVLQSIKTNVYP